MTNHFRHLLLALGIILALTVLVISPIPALAQEGPDPETLKLGAQLYAENCQMCHGVKGEGNGQLAAFLTPFRPANLTLPVIQTKSDGSLFLTISLGVTGRMPALNENLLVRERWDVVNFLRTLAAPVTAP